MSDKPIHVLVAAALGCKPSLFSGAEGRWHCTCPDRDHTGEMYHDPLMVARYDTDWSATGPLIERFQIALRPPEEPPWCGGSLWEAYAWNYPTAWKKDDYRDVDEITAGSTDGPLVAACNLILKLSEAGKLPALTHRA